LDFKGPWLTFEKTTMPAPTSCTILHKQRELRRTRFAAIPAVHKPVAQSPQFCHHGTALIIHRDWQVNTLKMKHTAEEI